jgi:2-polyprenyl-6-methoxyphenol hydroxylase-like FAD-dependent oxidoreductase
MGTLEDRGAGLGVTPELIARFLARPEESAPPYVRLSPRRIDADGARQAEPASLDVTTYGALYRALKAGLPDARYLPGHALEEVLQRPDGVRVRFGNGREAEGDVLVCADGFQAISRRLVLPAETAHAASYAGYVLWRGLLDDAHLTPALRERFCDGALHLVERPPYLLVVYEVPGVNGETEPGKRRLNWGWYFGADQARLNGELLVDKNGVKQPHSLAPGQVAPGVVASLRALAERTWPDAGRALFEATVAADRLFMQPISEYLPEALAAGRACLVGDAAHVASPITGSGARYAMYDALEVAECLAQNARDGRLDVPAALRVYERRRLQPSRQLVLMGRSIGAGFR